MKGFLFYQSINIIIYVFEIKLSQMVGFYNNQGLFANWLYGTPTTCKEGNGLQCAANQLGGSIGGGNTSS